MICKKFSIIEATQVDFIYIPDNFDYNYLYKKKKESIMQHKVQTIEETITIVLGLLGILLSILYGVLHLELFLIGSGCFFILWNMYQLCDEVNLKRLFFALLLLDSILLCCLTANCYIYFILIPLRFLLSDKKNHFLKLYNLSLFFPIIVYLIALLSTPNLAVDNVNSYLVLQIVLIISDLLIKVLEYYESINQKLYLLLASSAINELEQHNLNQKLAYQNTVIARTSRLKEREAIGRTIHNAVGHTITSAIVTLEASEVLLDKTPEEAKFKVKQAKERMQQSLSSIRQAVRLFDQTTTKVSIADLYDILSATLNEFMVDTTYRVRHNLTVTKQHYEQFIDVNTSEFLNGAVMEALSNGLRHGHATAFIVISELLGDKMLLRILDNGTTDTNHFYDSQRDLINHGYGLRKIRSFLNEIGGELKIDVKDGFQLTLMVPLISSTNETKERI